MGDGDRCKPSSVLPRNEALNPGVRVGRYELCKLLGRDRFGLTYQARDLHLKCDVTIKEYLPTDVATRQAGDSVRPRSPDLADRYIWGRDRLLADVATLQELGSAPGIARILECVEANSTAYVVIAAGPGETVAALLARQHRLPPASMERLAPSLLDALERMHARGFLHLDIKPSSIIVNERGQPALADFGMAHVGIATAGQSTALVPGSEYTALERFTGERTGPFTDVYGLAATLYRCTTGLIPPAAVSRAVDDSLVPASEIAVGKYRAGLLAGIDAGIALRATERPSSIMDWRPWFTTCRATTPHRDQVVTGSLIDQQAPPPALPEDKASPLAHRASAGHRAGINRRALASASAMALLAAIAGALVANSASRGSVERPTDQVGEVESAGRRAEPLSDTAETLRRLEAEWARHDREVMARTARRQQAEEEIRRAAEALRKRAGVQGRFEAERKRTGD